jgi:uncharacterized membrane protein
VNSERVIEWQFGGWHGLPPWLGWTLLLLAAAGGVALAAYFYRHTLRALTWRQRVILAALRSGFFLSLLLCLAGPARVERVYDSNHDARPLAVVVDRSESMTVPDQRDITRLSYALHAWKKVETDAIHFFPGFRYFSFSSSLVPAPDLESAATFSEPGAETHLYDSLDQAMKDAPSGGYAGIVCLTDGLDTTQATAEELTARAIQNHSPLYFVVGENHNAPRETLLVRETDAPGEVLRKSQFTATVLVEAHATRERDVPVSLWMEDRPVAQTTLHLHVGANLIPWSVPVDSGEPGLIHLACRLGDGAEQESTTTAVRVVASEQVHILFYQGTLDWSFHFINTALQNDSSFALTGLFNPNLNITQLTASSGLPAVTEMPDASDALQPFQIVVLSNVFADQLTMAQQTALIDYVRGGGGLLFLVSDNAMAQTFAGTPLESVLPVIFEAPPPPPDQDQSLQQFQDMMHSVGGADAGREDEFVADIQNQPGPDPLKSFALPSGARRSKIADLFAGGADGAPQHVPQFTTYARVHGVKAGGQILAVHPEDKTGANEPRALLVTQRFGQGQVTTLLTDTLWRWRLSLPSTDHAPEVFWQQLFLALAHEESGKAGMRFGVQPFFAALGQTCAFRLDASPGTSTPNVTALSPQGQTQVLALQAGAQSGSWSFELNPNQPGKWCICARDSRGSQVETLLRVSNASHTAELSGLPADRDGLRKLAESTGGCILNDGPPVSWSAGATQNPPPLVSKHSQPLWNNWAVLLAGLCFYVTELVWRRGARLL